MDARREGSDRMTHSSLILTKRHRPTVVATPPADPPLLTAHPADSLVDAFGINVHANFTGTWAQTVAWVDDAGALGVRHVRDRMPTSTNPADASVVAHKRLRDMWGIRVLGHSGADRSYGDTLASARARIGLSLDAVQAMGGAAADIYYALEGINEPNNDGVATGTWVAQTRNLAQALWDMHLERNSGPDRIDTIPIMGPSMARRVGGGTTFPGTTAADYAALGDVTGWCDIGQIHVYPAGKQPSLFISDFRGMAAATTPGLPLHCTEGGYFDAMQYAGGSDPTPADVNAIYILRQIFEHQHHGNDRFYLYELLDDVDPTNSARESNLGIVECPGTSPATWVRKLAWYAIRRLISLYSDPGPAHTPAPFRVGIAPPRDPTFKTRLYGRRDGTYLLAMWRDPMIFRHNKVGGQYVPGSGTYVATSNQTVTLTTGTPATFAFHRPSSQGVDMTSTPYHVVAGDTVASTTIAGELIIAEITPT